jgi:hypothetical protein
MSKSELKYLRMRRVTLMPCNEELAVQFDRVHPMLRAILFEAGKFVQAEFNFFILKISHIERDQATQDRIYLNHPNEQMREKYKKEPWKSVHQTKPCRGIDVPVDGMPEGCAEALVAHINDNFQYDFTRPWMDVAYLETHGKETPEGSCIHFQVRVKQI